MPEAFGPDARRKFFQSIPRPDMDRLSEQKDLALEKLQGQMERLQQRMKEMEEHNRELLDKLLQKDQTPKEHESGGPDDRARGAQEKRSHLTAMEIYLQGTGSRGDRSLCYWGRDIVIDILFLRG